MRLFIILRYIGLVMLLNSAFMFISAGISLYNDFDTGFYPLLLSGILTAILGVFPIIFVRGGEQIHTKEGYAIVVGAWLLSCLVSTMPYMLWGGEFNFINAWFESVSGFTTTGSSILNNVQALPNGLLFWRSATHWIGGMGVVLFVLLVLPSIGRIKMTLSSMEISSMARDNFRYRTQKILHILIVVYVGLTLVETILLHLAGMSWFDAVNHAFSTISTGGFSTRNSSLSSFNSPTIDMIVTFFMAISAIHFGLIFTTLTGRKGNNIFKSEVARYYLIFITVASIVVAISLFTNNLFPTFLSSLRHAAFQVVAVSSTTGFATTDSSVWPPLAIIILGICMIQCGCAGSTGGGVKCDRILLSFKSIRARMIEQQHHNAIVRVKINGVLQEPSVMSAATLFIVLYLMISAVATILLAVCGLDLMTSASAVMASIGNVGPGFGDVGSMANMSDLPVFAKGVLTILMLVGRLEIFGFIQLFFLNTWK